MKPDLSEFSYGFALTYELLQAPGASIIGVPVFPSLIEEGQPGGGWDVRIDRPTTPLFLQFKLADFMKRTTCKEAKAGFEVPCYRMLIRRSSVSEQHQLLLDLEASGQEVYYSVPAFHRHRELDDAFLARQVRARSLWLRPSDVGPLPDTQQHHVSFRPGGPWAVFSRRRDIQGRDFQKVAFHLAERVRLAGDMWRRREHWENLEVQLAELAETRRVAGRRAQVATQRALAFGHPVERVAYYASVFFEAQLFLAQRAPAS
jgi:hypothetical protein